MDLSWIDHLLAVLVGLVLPASAIAAKGQVPAAFSSADKIRLYWANSANLWLLAGLVLAAWGWEGRGWAKLGLAPPTAERLGLQLALTGLVVLLLVADAWYQLRDEAARSQASARWHRDTPFMPATRRELGHSMVLAASAGICEEIMFRGFIISYLVALFGGGRLAVAAAVLLPAVVFGLAHLYEGALRAGKAAVLGALLGALFVVGGSLWVPVVIHFLQDAAMSLLGAHWLMGGEDDARERTRA